MVLPFFKKPRAVSAYGWFGRYATWQEARAACSGYDSPLIVDRCAEAALKVWRGEAVYERDSCLFDRIEYSWPLLAALLSAAAKSEGRLNVLDYGGSFGSSYFQNRSFLRPLSSVAWNIVEQPRFVEKGKTLFAGSCIRFYPDPAACLREQPVNLLLMSSVIAYVEHPYDLLRDLLRLGIRNAVIDRTALIRGPDRLTVQKVPPQIYPASYPSWFLNREKFKAALTERYDIVSEFEAQIESERDIPIDGMDAGAGNRGFILEWRE